MKKWVVFGIIIGVSLAIGLGLWRTFYGFEAHEFLTKEDATKMLRNQYPYPSSGPEPEFGFLKYNGTLDGNPRFIIYQADRDSGTITKREGSIIFYEGQYGPIIFIEGEYFAKEITDRFVWILFDQNTPNANEYFVDAKTGEFIGIKRGLGYCHGKCNGNMK